MPLMVLQVPNTPDPNEIGQCAGHDLSAVAGTCPKTALPMCSANTPRRHSAGIPCPTSRRSACRIDTWVRVLIAKDAISTGWDCPRAEVMVSFRAGQGSDPHHPAAGPHGAHAPGAAHSRQ